MTYLPSKKFILKIFIIAFALSAVFWLVSQKNSKTDKLTYKKTETPNPNRLNQFLDKDSDNDGLKDWEEVLWKTDSQNPDTDKDGTSDGEEVKLNRNPLKPAPGDEFAASSSELNSEQEETLTQKIGREFLVQYLSLKGMENLNSEQKDAIINSMLAKISGEPLASRYNDKDIKILTDNSRDSVKTYINKLGKVFQNFKNIKTGELQIFTDILSIETEKDPEKIEMLKENEIIYKIAVQEILRIPTPSNYKNIHLGFLNNFSNAGEAISKMAMIYIDPAQAIIGFQIYINEASEIVAIFKDFKKQFYKDGIKMSPNEDGYIFIKDYFINI